MVLVRRPVDLFKRPAPCRCSASGRAVLSDRLAGGEKTAGGHHPAVAAESVTQRVQISARTPHLRCAVTAGSRSPASATTPQETGQAAMIPGVPRMSGEILYRAMFPDTDGGPQVGTRRNMLGVRPGIDVAEEPAGPGRGGMSVTVRMPTKMPAPIRPKEFGGLNGETVMYELQETALAPQHLALGEINPRNLHAVVEAADTCALSEFQDRLHATRPKWTRTAPPKEGP